MTNLDKIPYNINSALTFPAYSLKWYIHLSHKPEIPSTKERVKELQIRTKTNTHKLHKYTHAHNTPPPSTHKTV